MHHVGIGRGVVIFLLSRKNTWSNFGAFQHFSGEVSTVNILHHYTAFVKYLWSNDSNCIADFQTILLQDRNGQMQLGEVAGRRQRTMFSVQGISSMKIWTERQCRV